MLLVGRNPQLLPCGLSKEPWISLQQGGRLLQSRKSKREQGRSSNVFLWFSPYKSYIITSPIFHWSYRPTLTKCVRGQAWILGGKDQWEPSERLLQVITSICIIFCVHPFFFQFISISINGAYTLLILGTTCYSNDINSKKLKTE